MLMLMARPFVWAKFPQAAFRLIYILSASRLVPTFRHQGDARAGHLNMTRSASWNANGHYWAVERADKAVVLLVHTCHWHCVQHIYSRRILDSSFLLVPFFFCVYSPRLIYLTYIGHFSSRMLRALVTIILYIYIYGRNPRVTPRCSPLSNLIPSCWWFNVSTRFTNSVDVENLNTSFSLRFYPFCQFYKKVVVILRVRIDVNLLLFENWRAFSLNETSSIKFICKP